MWNEGKRIAVGLVVLFGSAACGGAGGAEGAARAYVDEHRDYLTEAGLDLQEFESDVVALCHALNTVSDPDSWLAREAGGNYWFWADDPEPQEERNSPDEAFTVADAVCGFDTGGAAAAGMDMFAGAQTQTTTPPATTAGVPDDPLDQMEIAFVGGYSRGEIKSRIETAMTLYGLELTDEDYSRAGSVLVALRREFGPTEMDILDYMIRSHVDGVNVSFPDGAALAVTLLNAGDQ